MNWPEAEVRVDEDAVRQLVAEQFPSLSVDTCHFAGEGFDNYLWRIGEELVVRLPRRAAAVGPLLNEITWLNSLAPHLSLRTPAPLCSGSPSERFAWPWAICQWIPGTPGDEHDAPDEASARAMAAFLRELHRDAPDNAPRNPWRGVALSERSRDVVERVHALNVNADPILELWSRACAAPRWAYEARWLHGDFHPGNMIYRDGALVGVVDFGDMCAGDPATDLSGAFLALDAPQLAAFFDSYGPLDEPTLWRTIGWAVNFGLIMTALGERDCPRYAAVGRRALANAFYVASLV